MLDMKFGINHLVIKLVWQWGQVHSVLLWNMMFIVMIWVFGWLRMVVLVVDRNIMDKLMDII